jgi:hypothetical protein
VTSARVLRHSWQTASVGSGWTGESDWWTPAVDAVSDALACRGTDARAACAALGRERADAGVPLDEARADLRQAARAAAVKAVGAAELLDALTIGWVEQCMDWLYARSCLDPLTDLAPVAYLATRLDEVRAEARLMGLSVHDLHALVIVRTAPTRDPIVRETRMITLQSVMREAFIGGETLARLGPTVAAALVARTPPIRLRHALGVLADGIDQAVAAGRLQSTRTWVEPLPDGPGGLPQLVQDLA